LIRNLQKKKDTDFKSVQITSYLYGTVYRTLHGKEFTSMRLLPCSCESTPIELIQNLLKQRIEARKVSPISLKGLRRRQQQSLKEIKHEYWIRDCSHGEGSLKQDREKCVDAGGNRPHSCGYGNGK
jgi:hypothetical protein